MLIDRVIVGQMYTNSYIVSTGKKECIIIDPGADGTILIQRLEAMNLIPKAIVLTHGHIDHTSASRELIDYYAGRGHHIVVVIHEEDRAFLGSSAADANHQLFAPFGNAGMEAFRSFGVDIPEAEMYVSDGEVIAETDLMVLHTPGHSSGSICLYSEPRQALFSGDTLFFNTIGRTDVTHGDEQSLYAAVSERLFALPPETRVFPGHGPLTSIEREIRNNPMVSEGATI
jgi:glyoxylase-like metal-dependent hydrolase (beta-lactamase superfamily II)